ncbi:GATA zinc finger domain-containing protein 3-like [Mercenaria mercenaria]|uniref:GATA zinc finger domain-containing protein 3-like n=1 Tax=Mercenaria mercenaria TaxID=6596 RepID=UPI00234F6FB4|nr:GATA zinc finger domain-containing protein 3-like [Mercenaria mercenaria]XP_045211692.2 GATA zinc finger domain-containing protein 3-like [Mercenaria mercenaria]XP_045211693.2 GATA zinc finger domain-containing protein 3-like [Mercenaria mercenaria]XP_045211694.2 GATA zinc finger domain-containing protein 3-like [Mercenaria mercenaria]XP_045211695.2 GATA zinc finger domain-containing protein 3-like [Mercenaria mercenaria]XP_045211696.2 GATA zinc finger domain-containing protein 3-like [Merc
MVNRSSMNLLFFFGVLIPALVTIALFVVFCYCWYKMRIRNQILYKKHDPHKIERLRSMGKNYEAPTPPPPPFKSSSSLLNDTFNHNNNNKNKSNDNYEESPEPTEGFDNPAMYRTNPDSGFSDLNQIQCHVDNSAHVQRSDSIRPNSQASDDSDDSGFRSSRSGQYIHSASSSTGNAQENCGHGGGVHSLQVHDSTPLFKPIKIHPNEMGQQPLVSYVNRNSSKHKSHRKRLPLPTSQHYSVGNTCSESHNTSSAPAINASQHQIGMMPLTSSNLSHSAAQSSHSAAQSSHNTGQSCNNLQYISKSINDVHGGRLHSIDSHVGPVTCAGNYGIKLCSDNCSNRNNIHPHGHYSDGTFSQPNSIGYGSDTNSFGQMHSIGYIGPVTDHGPIKQKQLCYQLPLNNQISMNGHIPVNSHMPVNSHIPGYNINTTSHMRPINPDNRMYGIRSPVHSIPETSQKLMITQAMVHKPYIEELSDPSLYSVV